MMWHRNRLRNFLLAFALLGMAAVASPVVQAATFTVINNDGAGEGFNDPSPRAPVGGNSGTTLGQQRLIAFQYAANIWGGLLSSNVTIRVAATFDPLPCNASSATLGQAGPTGVFRDFSGAPVANTWFAVALANALSGSDLDTGADDITAQFNSNFGVSCPFGGWYYGLDGNAGSLVDFVSVLLHELGHGLGFLTFVDLATGAKALGFNDTFMLNLENHGAVPSAYPSMSNAQRVAASTNTGSLHWTGANVRAASGVLTAGRVGDHVRMYAPNPQEPGSSVSHWDTALTPNQLMEPNYTVPLHSPVLELPLFQDIGWTLSASGSLVVSPATDINSAGPQGGPFSPSSYNYTLTATAGTRSYAISGVPAWLTPSSTSGTATTSGTAVTFTVNSSANALSPAIYSATITFTDTTSNTTALTVAATLIVDESSVLQVSPPTNMASVGNPGGPFSPPSFQYQLSTNSGTVSYSISGLPSWLNVSSISGSVTTTPITVTFTVNSNANSLPVGGYNATITFTNATNGIGNQTRNAALTVNSGGTAPPATRTWVSGNGDDANDCTLTAPCQTFAGALPKTVAGGEINCLDAAGFGVVTIDKAISIVCVPGTAGVLASGTDGVIVNAPAGAKVVLQGLDINGAGNGITGIRVVAASKVDVIRTTIRGMTTGITMEGTGAHLFVNDSFIMNNVTGGVKVLGTSNIASITNTSILFHTSFSVQANGAGNIVGVQASVLNDSPTGISLLNGGIAIAVGPSNLVTGAGAFTSTILFK